MHCCRLLERQISWTVGSAQWVGVWSVGGFDHGHQHNVVTEACEAFNLVTEQDRDSLSQVEYRHWEPAQLLTRDNFCQLCEGSPGKAKHSVTVCKYHLFSWHPQTVSQGPQEEPEDTNKNQTSGQDSTPTHFNQVDNRMDHVISSPVHMDVRTRGKRRRVTLLAPEALSTKRRKTTDRASRKKLKGVPGSTITTNQHLEKAQPGEGPSSGAQEPTVSFTPLDPRADVPSELATTTHEMVLKRVSTKRLLRLLGEFLCRRCHLLKDLTPAHPLRWIHVVDDLILFSGYQRDLFITPGSVVFLYMLCRDIVSPEVSSMKELQVLVLNCLYVAYAYIGHELSYPAMAFIAEENRDAFWRRTWAITWHMSGKMLKINNDPEFFKDVFTDLKTAADH
ncbi:hypothetical protein NFI96_006449 [Prochilodus magdalenae]|nr:hypothetical protein NFI96_006449 [Prochilodus magdalenae]